MSDQENKQQGAESVEENTETVKPESAETSVPESGATPPAEEKTPRAGTERKRDTAASYKRRKRKSKS